MTASGMTPLDVMIETYRWLRNEAAKETNKGAQADAKLVRAYLIEAAAVAKDAAPYVHPRLAAIEHMGKGGGPIEFTDAHDKLAALIDRLNDADAEGSVSPTSH